jgi:hypothetical protein
VRSSQLYVAVDDAVINSLVATASAVEGCLAQAPTVNASQWSTSDHQEALLLGIVHFYGVVLTVFSQSLSKLIAFRKTMHLVDAWLEGVRPTKGPVVDEEGTRGLLAALIDEWKKRACDLRSVWACTRMQRGKWSEDIAHAFANLAADMETMSVGTVMATVHNGDDVSSFDGICNVLSAS